MRADLGKLTAALDAAIADAPELAAELTEHRAALDELAAWRAFGEQHAEPVPPRPASPPPGPAGLRACSGDGTHAWLESEVTATESARLATWTCSSCGQKWRPRRQALLRGRGR